MIKIITIILLVLLVLFFVVAFIHLKKSNRILKDTFKNHNVIVYGAKGKGKDLLFQKVIYLNRNKPYTSNISYGYNCTIRPLQDLNIDPNTYDNFINNDIKKCIRNDSLEGVDYYLSDGGIYLPSQYDHILHKTYPSFSIYYALSRHLYNSNIHINTQALTRLWKAIREQGDYYIRCIKVIKIFNIFISKICLYEKYESALNNYLPINTRILNKFSKAEVDQYTATNGFIQNRYFITLKKHIKYDTRHFKDIVF